MNIAIVGGRSVKTTTLNLERLKHYIDTEVGETQYRNGFIVSGGARGADTLAQLFAKKNGLNLMVFYPDWEKLGRGAGYARNHTIVENADIVFALWNGVSRGTGHTIELTKSNKKDIVIVDVDERGMIIV